MEEPPGENSLLQRDLPCVHCGYNLRMQATQGRCPECGRPVEETISLNAELARSRPGWLRTLAIANVILVFARTVLVVIYSIAVTRRPAYSYEFAGWCALIMTGMYLGGIFLLTQSEHPFFGSRDRNMVWGLRALSAASFLCIASGLAYQATWTRVTRTPQWYFGWSGHFWQSPAILLLVVGWLIYCWCVVVEYRYLASLAGRLLDRFMIEHCKIAGIGASVSSVFVLWVVPSIFIEERMPHDMLEFGSIFLVILAWILFLVWTAFMNIYCAVRFIQQARLATKRWQESVLTP